MTAERLTLSSGAAEVVVAPAAGGRVASLRVAGLDLLIDAEEAGANPLGWGCYAMAPWAGRVDRGRFTFGDKAHRLERSLPPHAIHGTVWGRPWEVEEVAPTACRLSAALAPGWPFGGRAVEHIELASNALTLTLAVHAGDGAMPATCGWHRWWRRDLRAGGPLELDAELGARWERDRDGIPTGDLVAVGERPARGWDDCFTDLGRPPVLRWPGALEITVESNCPHLVVFDEPLTAMCVEPLTAPPNAFNLGLAQVLEPGGEPLVARVRLAWMMG